MTHSIENRAVDPIHSDITFKIKHPLISEVKGYSQAFDAGIFIRMDVLQRQKLIVVLLWLL